MRILLINYEYPPVGAGAATSARLLAREFAVLGHQVCVLTSALGRGSDQMEEGVRVIRLDVGRTQAEEATMFQMLRFVIQAAGRVAIVSRDMDACLIYFSMPCGPLGLMARWFGNTPYVISLRGGDVPGAEPGMDRMHRLLAPLRRLVMKRAASVVANSEGLRTMSLAADPVAVDVIANGVDVTTFSPPEFCQENDPPVCLFVGRWRVQKQLDFVLQCVAKLRDAGVSCQLWLVGGGSEEPGLRQLVRNLHLENIVSFHPWCGMEALLDHYRGADVFINLSLYEGMPNTVLEAMACGLPVLASDVAGNDAVVKEGVTGHLVPVDDMDMTARRLGELLGSTERRREMGRAARKCVENEFSVQAMAAAYETALRNAAAQPA